MNLDQVLSSVEPEVILAAAASVMQSRIRQGPVFDSPGAVKSYLQFSIGAEPRENFKVLFLDSQHRLISSEIMFIGTLNQTSVYPREVARRALALNASAVVLSHNHPSGSLEPSRADEYLTGALKSALQTVDVRVLDHIIVSVNGTLSFAERGLC